MYLNAEGRRRLPDMIRALAVMALTGTMVVSVGVAPAASLSQADQGASAGRYAGMPAPEAFDPPTTTGSAANQASSNHAGASTIRLQGLQRLYWIDSSGRVVRERRADLGMASIFSGPERVQVFGQQQYLQLSNGRFAGWWVAAPTADPTEVTAFDTPLELRVQRGRQVGVHFYANATVRARLSVQLNATDTVQASRRATFAGRVFYYVTNGPLADRWVAQRATTLLGQAANAGDPPPTIVAEPAATWKALVLVYRDTDVSYTRADGTDYHLQARMDNSMHNLVIDTLNRTDLSVSSWSGGLADMDMDVVNVPHPLTSLDQLGNGYWVGPRSVEADINEYAPRGSYDSIFVVWQSKDDAGQQVPVAGWGLTLPPGSWANGAGYSSVITPSWEWWWTNSPAPEEVFVHEWMHQVIFFNHDAGRLNLDLHAGASYGYSADDGTWRKWLSDVMQGQVWDGDAYIGVNAEMWAAGTPNDQ